MTEENNDSENPKVDENSDSSIGTEIKKKLENEFAKNLFPLIQKYKQELSTCEDNLQRALADYQNLEKHTQTEIYQRVLQKTNQLMLNFIGIYEDFIRAKTALTNDGINTEGLDGIIKNMETLLAENNIKPIDALGEIFDPNLHEAISIISDPSLDDNTITKEIRKGYISHERTIRPTLVEISKKENDDKK